MTKILVLHGKGMELRGKVDVEIFGTMTLPEYDEHIRRYAAELGVDVEIFHSNEESEVIAKMESTDADAALINPGGYTTGHPSLAEAIREQAYPTLEVHMSNPARQGAGLRDWACLPGRGNGDGHRGLPAGDAGGGGAGRRIICLIWRQSAWRRWRICWAAFLRRTWSVDGCGA